MKLSLKSRNKLRNKLRGLIQRCASERLKRYLWNAEFSGGRWDFIYKTPNDCIYPYIEKYANGGSILDLGCGTGNTSNEIPVTVYADYTGVDISDVAVAKAIKRSLDNGRSAKNRYLRSDFATYAPNGQFDLILFRESLYYLPPANVEPTLERYSKYLKPGGVIIVRLCDWSGKCRPIVELIEREYEVVDQHLADTRAADSTMVGIIVFQRRSRSRCLPGSASAEQDGGQSSQHEPSFNA